jgi:hypothetical protein
MYLLYEYFQDSPQTLQALSLASLAFTVWMLIDSYRRGAEYFWYFIIFFFQPIGGLIYFFVVKLPGMRLGWGGAGRPVAAERKLSLDELEYRVQRSPTVAHRLALAQRLMDKGRHYDAVPHLEEILKVEPGYCQALHDLAECRLAAGQPNAAVPLLERLLERDRRWSNYRGWRTLIEVQLARKDPAGALKACRELEKQMPTLENRCLLAEHLLDNGLKREAVDLLDQALEDHRFTPLAARLRNWRTARQAERLLAEAEKP